MRHVTAILVAIVLATSLAAVPAAVAAPAVASAAAPRASAPGRPAPPPKFLSPAVAKSAALAARVASAPRPRIAHLDPKLQASTNPASSVNVTISGDVAQVATAVGKLGGQVLASVSGAVSAVVPRTKLVTLAGTAGIAAVKPSVRAVVLDSEGVSASNAGPPTTAGTWQNSGDNGASVTVGIVDAGFANLSNEVAAGHLPSGTTATAPGTNQDCAQAGMDSTQHGTAVAEIVHQMAPAAQLVLYCVADQVGFQAAEQALQAAGVKIVNSSLGFPGDSRGDGTGAPGSAAQTVETARQHGILWIQSAGNNGEDHWSGTLVRDPATGLVPLDGTSNEADQVDVPSGASADLVLQWDQWPVSSAPLTLTAVAYLCPSTCSTTPYATQSVSQPSAPNHPTSPVLDLPVTNTSGSVEVWVVSVGTSVSLPTVRYDLSYWGDVSGSSYLASLAPARAAAGSMAEPASSPYAFAVGAANAVAYGQPPQPPGTLEPFSSQGPTIDGRVKPDITGWDGVSSYLSDFSTGFYGTSAAAPHVAGAAALVLAANPSMGAAQLEYFLEQRAGSGQPSNPPTNATGYGLLTLGALAGVAPPSGARYTPIAPTRILDTRTTTGGALKAGATLTLSIPGLPADATAVAINLTGVGATGTTFLSAYPGGAAWPGTSNLNLSTTDPTAAVFAVVSLRNGAITIRNNAATANVVVDELGYFGTGSETGSYDALPAPIRVLDTRTTTGGHLGPLGSGQSVTVDPAAPPGATAAVVNVTVTDVRPVGFVSAAPACTVNSSTVNYGSYTRANLAIVQLDTAGTFCITNRGVAVDVVVDVVGYLGPTGFPYVGQYVALPSPQRIVDTRTGNGGSAGGLSSKPLGPNTATGFYGSQVGVVPASATALLAGVVEASTSTGGYLSLYPGATAPAAATSSLNFTPGRTVPNAVIVGLSGRQFGIYNVQGQTQVAVDLFGYFD